LSAPINKPRETLGSSEFIRHKLYSEKGWLGRRYAALVLANPSMAALLRYEFVNLFVGLPGAFGLASRGLLFKQILASCGSQPIFGRNLNLRHPDNIHLGDSVTLDDCCVIDARGAGDKGIRLNDRVMINRGACVQAKVGAINIGKDTGVGAFSQIISQGPIDIAENVSIAGGSMIAGGRYDVDLSSESPTEKVRFTGGPIVIEANVRIGMGAIILDGVTLGENSIVAPGSVVYDSLPPGTIAMGNPARPLRQRRVSLSEVPTRQASTAAMPVKEVARDVGASQRDSDARQVIRKYLEETHYAEFGPGKLGDDDSLFDHQVVDSIGLVGLISMIEEHFEIEFTDDDLVPEKLSTVNGLVSIVNDKK